jgi:menaquinone-9 beta-reductase
VVVRAGGGAISAACLRRDPHVVVRLAGVAAGEALLRHALAGCSSLQKALEMAKQKSPWLGAGPLHPGMRPLYQDGVFSVGNAAGEAHPVVGEGIAMAMQSAALLAEALIREKNDLAAAAAYSLAWRERFRARIVASACFARVAMLPVAPALVGLLGRFPRILEGAARVSGKLLPGTP